MTDIDPVRDYMRAKKRYEAHLAQQTARAKQPMYEPGSEQFLAAVWYVMKRASQRYRETKRGQQIGRWAFLNWVLERLDLESRTVGYPQMRSELIEFAEGFGVRGYSKEQSSVSRRVNSEARKEFQ